MKRTVSLICLSIAIAVLRPAPAVHGAEPGRTPPGTPYEKPAPLRTLSATGAALLRRLGVIGPAYRFTAALSSHVAAQIPDRHGARLR